MKQSRVDRETDKADKKGNRVVWEMVDEDEDEDELRDKHEQTKRLSSLKEVINFEIERTSEWQVAT